MKIFKLLNNTPKYISYVNADFYPRIIFIIYINLSIQNNLLKANQLNDSRIPFLQLTKNIIRIQKQILHN